MVDLADDVRSRGQNRHSRRDRWRQSNPFCFCIPKLNYNQIEDLLHEQEIRLMTTKTGDVIVKSIGDHTGHYRAINLKDNSQEVSSTVDFVSKKSRILAFNADTLRQRYQGRNKYGPK